MFQLAYCAQPQQSVSFCRGESSWQSRSGAFRRRKMHRHCAVRLMLFRAMLKWWGFWELSPLYFTFNLLMDSGPCKLKKLITIKCCIILPPEVVPWCSTWTLPCRGAEDAPHALYVVSCDSQSPEPPAHRAATIASCLWRLLSRVGRTLTISHMI